MPCSRRWKIVLMSLAVIFPIGLATTACTKSPIEKEAAFLAKGKALRSKGEYARAILEFRNAVKAMPKDAEPYYQLGVTYVNQQDVRNAFAMFSKAVALNPKHAGAQLQLSTFQILGSQGKQDPKLIEDAQRRIAEVLAAKPDD